MRDEKGRFIQGNKEAKKGHKHKTTELKSKLFELALDKKWNDKLTEELNNLKGKDYVNAYLKICEFILPKPVAEPEEEEHQETSIEVKIIDNGNTSNQDI